MSVTIERFVQELEKLKVEGQRFHRGLDRLIVVTDQERAYGPAPNQKFHRLP